MARVSISLLVAATCLIAACSQPSGPPTPTPDVSSVANYYMPLSTTYQYHYMHLDWSNGASNPDTSFFVLSYRSYNTTQTVDGYHRVDNFITSDTDGKNPATLQTFITDSQVVEYGSDDGSANHRIVRLSDSLRSGASWLAASSYLTPKGNRVAIQATVDTPLTSLTLSLQANSTYSNVYEVDYVVTQSMAEEPGFQSGAFTSQFYAYNYGKILEKCFADPAGQTELWENRLLSVTTN